MFKSLKTRFFTQYHLFVFIVIFALKNPRNPCGLWDFTDVIYFGRQSWLRYRGTVRFTFFRPLLRFPKKTLAPDSAGKNFIFPPLRRTPFASRKRGSKIPVSQPEKTDTPVWVCPFAFIKFFEYRGTLRSRIFRTLRAFGEKSRVLETTQSAAAARRCGCFGEPLSLRENGVLKSPYRNLKKTDTPVWVCPFIFI